MTKLVKLADKTKGITQKGDDFTAELELLHLEPGYNVRDVDMNHVFQFSKSFLRGDYIPAITVQPTEINGKPALKIIDGQHRYFGFKLAMRNPEFKRSAITITEFVGGIREQIVHMMKANSGKNLTSLEFARGMMRLASEGETQDNISKIFNISPATVSGNIAVARFADEHTEFAPLLDNGILGMSIVSTSLAKFKEKTHARLSALIRIEELDITPILNPPRMTENMTEEAFEAQMTEFKKKVALLKREVTANMKALKPRRIQRETVTEMTTLVEDILLLIKRETTEGKTAQRADGRVTVKLDGALVQALYSTKLELEEVNTHNKRAIEIGKRLGMSDDELDDYETSKPSASKATSSEDETEIAVDNDVDYEAGSDDIDAFDPCIDPDFDQSQNS
ncbi:hypothetical protein LMH73_015980 [Vibrio splendidus]|nr:hypothetical protein [Vibrio splendidus]MCC4880436.1 hypothetical protein [Vibrio splendidus]